ncbi:MAG TPA: hypothetical protein VGG38_15500 [Acidimicrobiales bacterium]|jgi:hypothetical protein
MGIVLAGLFVPFVRSETSTAVTTAGTTRVTPPSAPVAASSGGTTTTVASSTAGEGTAPTNGGVAQSGGASASGSQTQSIGSGQSAATNQPVNGVTATQIKIGIGLINVGGAAQFGYNFNIGNEQARYQALINTINNTGGVDGRKIIPYYESFDVTDPTASSQAACIDWTQTDHVFAVLVESQFPIAAEVCILQAETPLITTQGTEQSYYGNNLLFTTLASDNRTLQDQADFLASSGMLTGKTIGIVSGDGSDELAVDNTLMPALKKLGFSVKDIEIVPDSTAAVQEEPIAISNLQAAGVNLVIMADNVVLSGPFAQSASQAGYNPEYAISDFNNQINPATQGYFPASFNGTIGLSQTQLIDNASGVALSPADQACVNIVDPADPTVLPTSNAAFPVAMGECAIFDLLMDGIKGAGQGLTLSSWLAGMNTIGSSPLPNTQGGSINGAKHDFDDYEQEVIWKSSCTCWQLLSGAPTPERQLS